MKLNMFNINGNYVVSPSATMDVVDANGILNIVSPIKTSDEITMEQFRRDVSPVSTWLVLYKMAKNCGITWIKRERAEYSVYLFDRKDNPEQYDEFLELMCDES